MTSSEPVYFAALGLCPAYIGEVNFNKLHEVRWLTEAMTRQQLHDRLDLMFELSDKRAADIVKKDEGLDVQA